MTKHRSLAAPPSHRRVETQHTCTWCTLGLRQECFWLSWLCMQMDILLLHSIFWPAVSSGLVIAVSNGYSFLVKCSRLASGCRMCIGAQFAVPFLLLPTSDTTHMAKYGIFQFQNKLETQLGTNGETNLSAPDWVFANKCVMPRWRHPSLCTVSDLNPVFSRCDYACPELTEHLPTQWLIRSLPLFVLWSAR